MRVLRSLKQRFSSPESAEQFFAQEDKENRSNVAESHHSRGLQDSPSHEVATADENVSSEGSHNIECMDTLQPFLEQASQMKPEEQIAFVGEVFSQYCSRQNVAVSGDFLELAVNGMAHLHIAGRSNILYGLSKGLGSMHSDGSDTVFPCKQMVAGLVEHCVNFFSRDQVC